MLDLTSLDNDHALAALAVFTSVHQNHPGLVSTLDANLRAALAEAFPDAASSAGPSAAPADAARAALVLLAEHPEHGSAIRALIEGPRPKRYDLGTTALVVTGVLVALQLHVRIERDPKGRYQILIEKKATDAKLLSELVRKLLNLKG